MEKRYAGTISGEQRFRLQWMLATMLGFLFGGAVSGALVRGGETSFDDVTSPLLGALLLGVTSAIASACSFRASWRWALAANSWTLSWASKVPQQIRIMPRIARMQAF
jgi:VIT1/CCC1 family predicted Fe2+/Mn2+ transporter